MQAHANVTLVSATASVALSAAANIEVIADGEMQKAKSPETADQAWTYTFIEGVKNPFSCTVLVKGAHKHVLEQIKDAVRDGLRAVSNAMTDGFLVAGAGAFEIIAHAALLEYKSKVTGRAKLGVQAYADALLVIPKTLAANAGYDAQDSIIKLQEVRASTLPRQPQPAASHPNPSPNLDPSPSPSPNP